MRVGRGLVLVVAMCGMLVPEARAQGAWGVSAGALAPTGDLSDIAGTGFGVNGYLGLFFSSHWMVKGEVGYHSFGSEDIEVPGIGVVQVEGAVVPVRLGLRKYWGEARRFFTGPNLGIFIPVDDFEDFDSKFGLGPQIGYAFPVSEATSVAITLEWNNVFIGDENPLTNQDRVLFEDDKINYFMVTLGFTGNF